MGHFNELLTSIVPTFGVVWVGWFCRKIKIWNKGAVRALNSYAYYIALPALIFQSLVSSDLGSHLTIIDLKLVGGVLAAHVVIFGITYLLVSHSGFNRNIRAVAPMLLTFGSTAYLGIPYVSNTFGTSAVSFAAIVSVSLVVVLLFLSIFSLERETDIENKKSFLHELLELPFLYAVVLGLFFGFAKWHIPHFVGKTIDVFAGSAGSTALLAIGAFDYDFKFKKVKIIYPIFFGFGKVFLSGIATFFLLKFLGVTGELLAIGTSMGSVSIAVTAFVLADKYKVARELTDAAMVFSGLAAFVALTVISFLWFSTGVFK